MASFEEIVERFEENLARAENLILIYDRHIAKSGKGRRPARDTDILRAAVVLTHAALEDFLRSITIEKLPACPPDTLDSVPLKGTGTKAATKFALGALAHFRTLTVEELIQESVREYQQRWATFNDLGQVKRAISLCGADPETLTYGKIPEAIGRRHRIVHHADLSETVGGSGNHRVNSIRPDVVRTYITDVRQLLAQVQPLLLPGT